MIIASLHEYVPLNDRTGPTEPQRVYTLFSAPQTTSTKEPEKPGFYVGGNIYSDWASVPESYKLGNGNSDPPDPRRSTASVFKFKW